MSSYTALSEADYQDFLVHIANEAFDSGILTKAKSFVQKTRLSAAQIAGIMDKFTFDDSRLKFAKFAYESCYDPVNYYKVNQSFTFSSNAKALDEYIANK